MRYSTNKDFNKIIRQLIKQGWQFKYRSKHGQITAPNGKCVIFSKSPSDYRAVKNFMNDIKYAQKGYAQ